MHSLLKIVAAHAPWERFTIDVHNVQLSLITFWDSTDLMYSSGCMPTISKEQNSHEYYNIGFA